jgi:ribosomal protein S18 acetylase RimI-like enzyme
MPGEVTLRPTRPHGDGEFLLSLYSSTRTDELAIVGWPQEQLDAFVRMQFEAQSRGYAATFPGADNSVVIVDGMAAGRLIVDRSDDEIRIVDIALLPEFRRAGVGSTLVRPLLEEADATGLPVRCHVAEGNDARKFWERFGLVAGSSDGAYVAMERACSI